MISQRDTNTIIELAKHYNVGRVLLFGSSADPEREGADIDLAVQDIDPGQYFYLYGDLILRLSKPVDLVDLSNDTKFNRLILRDGVPVYERSQ